MSCRSVAWLSIAVVLWAGSVSGQQPNVRVAISREFANLAAQQTIDRCDRLDEVILGTRIRGLGRAIGAVHFEFVPFENAAAIDLVMTAVSTDLVNSIGTNGPVVLITNGTAQLSARKRVFLTPEGIATWPAIADAVPNADLKRIDTHFHGVLDKFVRKVALAAFNKGQDDGMAIGRAIAVDKLTRGFDTEVDPRVAKANLHFIHDLREPLRQRGLYPQSVQLRTDADYLYIMGSLIVPPLDPPPIEPPPEFPAGTQLAGWLHESLPNSFLTRIFAGKKYTGEQLAQEIGKLFGGRAPAAPTPADAESFAIQFAEKSPIALAFRDGTVGMTVRSVAFTSGETEYDGPLFRMDTTVKYRLSLRAGHMVAERVGALEVLPTGYVEGKRLSFRQQSLRVLMRKQLEPHFPRIFEIASTMPTPAGFARIGKLGLERIVVERGWLAGSMRWIAPVVE